MEFFRLVNGNEKETNWDILQLQFCDKVNVKALRVLEILLVQDDKKFIVSGDMVRMHRESNSITFPIKNKRAKFATGKIRVHVKLETTNDKYVNRTFNYNNNIFIKFIGSGKK